MKTARRAPTDHDAVSPGQAVVTPGAQDIFAFVKIPGPPPANELFAMPYIYRAVVRETVIIGQSTTGNEHRRCTAAWFHQRLPCTVRREQNISTNVVPPHFPGMPPACWPVDENQVYHWPTIEKKNLASKCNKPLVLMDINNQQPSGTSRFSDLQSTFTTDEDEHHPWRIPPGHEPVGGGIIPFLYDDGQFEGYITRPGANPWVGLAISKRCVQKESPW